MDNPMATTKTKRQYILDEIEKAVKSDLDHLYHAGALEQRDGALWGYLLDDERTEFAIEVWVSPGAEKSAERVVLTDTATMTLQNP